MTDTNFDGTWTLLIGEEEANADSNSRIVVQGKEAWDAETPELRGSFTVGDGTVTVTLPGAIEETAPTQIVAHLLRTNRLSGTLNMLTADDGGYCEPCTLSRGLSLWARVPAKVLAHPAESAPR